MLGWESNKVLKKRSITTVYQNTEKEKRNSPRPGIEPGPSTWQAEILTTRLSRIVRSQGDRKPRKRNENENEKKKKIQSFEPDLNQRPMDFCYSQLQSTALPTELSKVPWDKRVGFKSYFYVHALWHSMTFYSKCFLLLPCLGGILCSLRELSK